MYFPIYYRHTDMRSHIKENIIFLHNLIILLIL